MTGCFSTQAPKCSDEDVKITLNEIYTEHIETLKESGNPLLYMFISFIPSEMTSIESIRTAGYDEKIKMRSCKANVTFDNNQSAAIEYSIQLDEEDADNFYVEINTEFFEEMLKHSMMQNIMN